MIKKSFQRVYDHDSRRSFVEKCKRNSPDRVPVFVYPAQPYESRLKFKTNKYIVRSDMIMSEFMYFIRTNCESKSSALGMILFTDRGELPCMTHTVEEIYLKYADTDGFLYIQVALEAVFG